MSENPCESTCQRGHGPACYAKVSRHARYCELIADGRQEYAELVDRRTAEGPTIADQIASVASAAIAHAAGGFETVDEAELEQRLALCRACEHLDTGEGKCRLCGCLMALKARSASLHCPIGKW